jgi:hypothetical protein
MKHSQKSIETIKGIYRIYSDWPLDDIMLNFGVSCFDEGARQKYRLNKIEKKGDLDSSGAPDAVGDVMTPPPAFNKSAIRLRDAVQNIMMGPISECIEELNAACIEFDEAQS